MQEQQESKLGFAKKHGRFLLYGINQLLWPAVCVNCGAGISEGDNNLCRDCWDELLVCTGGDYCGRCGRDASIYATVAGACPDCQGREIHFDGIARGGVYADALRKMILAFKNGRSELDSMLWLLADSAMKGGDFKDKVDFFVPVPLHWTRRIRRGFNQAHILARRLEGKSSKISTDLVRVRRTKLQPDMVSAAARARNVAGAFAVRRGHRLEGKNICLVDDIKTSGATLNECAKTLKQDGASKVFAVVLAVAGQGGG